MSEINAESPIYDPKMHDFDGSAGGGSCTLCSFSPWAHVPYSEEELHQKVCRLIEVKFALESSLKSAREELDILREKHKHGAEACHQAWNRIRESEADRDAWKSIAEKMAEALKKELWCAQRLWDDTKGTEREGTAMGASSTLREIKEALAQFDQMRVGTK